jgi:hypothetical protein
VLIFIKRDDERVASRKKMGNYSIKLESLLVLCKMEGAVTESRVGGLERFIFKRGGIM